MSSAFPSTRVASGLAVKTFYETPDLNDPKGRPVKIFVPGYAETTQTVVSEPVEFTTHAALATHVGYKSTIYETISNLKPQFAAGVGSIPIVYFPVAVTTGVAALGDVTPVGTCTFAQTYRVKINNKPSGNIDMAVDDTVADFIGKAVTACNGVLDMPMTASDGTTTLDFVAGFYTDAGDLLYIEIESPTGAEMTFSMTQPTGGGGTVDYSTIWAVFKEEWHSHVVNACGDATDSTFLDSSDAFGELRWGPEVHKPFKCYTGSNEATAATIRAITDARKDDRTNSVKWSPGSNDLPWTIAGRMIGMMAPIAAGDPAMDYLKTRCTGLQAGPAASQADSGGRDEAVKDGLSTVIVDPPTLANTSGNVYIEDSVMCYHADGEDPPGYRWDVDVEKENAMLWNIVQIFSDPNDAGNPLVPDGQATNNPNARKPSYFKGKLSQLYDGMENKAVITDSQYAKDNTTVTIAGPRRLDVRAVYKLSTNNGINAVDNVFTVYVGGELS